MKNKKCETITYIWMKSPALKQTTTHGIAIRSNNGKVEKNLSFNSIENVITIVFECVHFFFTRVG